MRNHQLVTLRITGGLLAALALAGLGACTNDGSARSTNPTMSSPANSAENAPTTPQGGSGVDAGEPPSPAAAKAMTPAKPTGQPGAGQELFDTDADAAKALATAAKADDRAAMSHIFGPAGKELASGDRVQDRNDREDFARRAAEQLRLVQKNDHTSVIYVGKDEWPFPIPLTRMANGKWFFDTEAGKEEILSRRIGEDELETIDVCRAYVAAQREYASQERDDSGVLQYAQHLVSTPGHHDGLYWETKPGEPESPFGPLVAEARMEGYGDAKATGHHQPFHGYYFHILTKQGANAPGGAYSYIINGHMIAGFALVASPDKYGSSGIMTFVISHQGKLYQKDLGAKSGHVIKEYNPDSTWTLVKD